jgi:hypothetical protein
MGIKYPGKEGVEVSGKRKAGGLLQRIHQLFCPAATNG